MAEGIETHLSRQHLIPTVEIGRFRRYQLGAIEKFEESSTTTKEKAT